ncbi:hypothetical protein JOH48_007958 [Bradyrhizobium elkanii]|nr:hypothetical protein [Bradyrhizobium elkanii]
MRRRAIRVEDRLWTSIGYFESLQNAIAGEKICQAWRPCFGRMATGAESPMTIVILAFGHAVRRQNSDLEPRL